jgi:propionate CoA-transferase
MTPQAAEAPIVRREIFDGEEWLYFPVIKPDIAIIRATSADERGNLSFEHEGAYLGALELAMSARNTGGVGRWSRRKSPRSGTCWRRSSKSIR